MRRIRLLGVNVSFTWKFIILLQKSICSAEHSFTGQENAENGNANVKMQ
jgi:hypothetical protein